MCLVEVKTSTAALKEIKRPDLDFYGDLVQNLTLWQARPPKLREAPEPQPDPPPVSALDEREVGEASDPASGTT